MANAASVHAAKRDPGQFEVLRGERAVPGGEERVVEPSEQLAERRGGSGDHHRGQREAGQRPPGPPCALGPGEPERADLQLPAQDRCPGERPDQHRNRHQHGRGALAPDVVAAEQHQRDAAGMRKATPQLGAGRHAGVAAADPQPHDQQIGGQHAEENSAADHREPVLPPAHPAQPPPRHRPQALVVSRLSGCGQCGHFVASGVRPRRGGRARWWRR